MQMIIDTDIHNATPSSEALHPYLSSRMLEVVTLTAFKGPDDSSYPPGAAISARPGIASTNGEGPESPVALLGEQHLDPLNVAYGILNCAYEVQNFHNPYDVAALASAVNDWQLAQWLEPEPRLRGSLVVPSIHPELAAKEIRRLGDQPSFVQVYLPVHSATPYGNPYYFPIYEAAVEHDIVIGLHFGGSSGNPPTPSGWPSTYVELYADMASLFQSQIISIIAQGVFARFTELRIAIIESGVTWLPSLMWRMDKEWKGLRREIPWVKHLPSDYIREHFRFTIQPLDAPPDLDHLQQVYQQIGSDDLLMYSSDYPHKHGDTLAENFIEELPVAIRQKIMADNARAFYRL
jgi:hypothetical protein